MPQSSVPQAMDVRRKVKKIQSKEPFLLFHWSPSERRKQIVRRGLVPGSRSVDLEWNPPYICFSDSPSLSWSLCIHRDHVKSWDLWMVWSNQVEGVVEFLFSDIDDTVKEYRVYTRTYKRNLWYVGSRVI